MHSVRAQASVEYVTMVGVMLVIIAFISGYAFILYNDSLSNSQAIEATAKLRNAVESVAALGNGNQIPVEIYIPNSVSDFRVENNALQITTTSFGASATDTVLFDFNVNEALLPVSNGSHTIIVKNINGDVNLNEA